MDKCQFMDYFVIKMCSCICISLLPANNSKREAWTICTNQ